jgi:Abnormal spindle-like microcephaly-assoc'd, ASPM-SPD-2-Hydin
VFKRITLDQISCCVKAAAYPDVRILEYRGVTTLDVAAGASGNSTSANSGAATTKSPNELIFGANTVATGNAAAGSGFTSRIITSPDSDIAEDKIVTAAGSNSATATLTSAGPWVMQMVAFGTAAVATTPQLSASASSLSFGSVTVNSSATQSVTLTSSGTAPVTVSSASVSGKGFSLGAASLPVTLNPNQSLTLQVQFAPTATGSATGSLTIGSTSASGGTTTVSLSGTGTAANPQLSLSATSLSFGSVNVNSTAKQPLTLTSSGTSAVTVNSASVSGTGFSLVGGSFPVSLNPNQTATVTVQFAPTATGSDTGSLTINSNSTSGPTATVSLSGTGAALSHQVTLSWTAPTGSPDPVAGYNIYRSTSGGANQLLNTAVDTQTSYVDSTVSSSTTYSYTVTSVDSQGNQSVPSSPASVTVP